jgi:hypothetical protein
MSTRITTADDVKVAPELEPLNLEDKADGPASAAFISAGIGIFVLGLLTVIAHASKSFGDFLANFDMGQGVGPLAGKAIIAVLAWLISWGILAAIWRAKDTNLKVTFYIGLGLGILGAIGTFPPFFESF